MKILFLTTFWALIAFSCNGQKPSFSGKLDGNWYIELEENDIGAARTSMYFETGKETFEAYTRKGADKDILGGWTSLLGRTFTRNFKNGSLLRMEKGIFREEKDSVRLAAILTSALGRYNIEGVVKNDSMFLRIRNGDTYRGFIKGYRKKVPQPLENYPAIFEKAFLLTNENIYNRAALQQPQWTSFVRAMRQVSPQLQDDLEMLFAFFYYSGKLPFSHYALVKMAEKEAAASAPVQRVFPEELNPQTGYLKITSFDGSVEEIDSAFDWVRQKKYQRLVVDLRGNPGGSVAAGMAFATHLTDSAFYGGIFLTQKYFNKNATLPSVEEYSRFPHFSASNFDLILKGIHNEEGLCLKVIPAPNPFQGKLYFLTDNGTASTCEPIVYGFKQQKRALVIGQKTAGAMLNGEFFDLEKGFKMVIPTADYYTADGFKIDQNGVTPNIATKPEDALEYVKKTLLK